MRTDRLAAIVAVALSLAACRQTGIPGDEDDGEAITAAGCGVERWNVKTGTDPLAPQVNMTAQNTTIAALGALPVPSGLASGSPRFQGTAEMQLFRLTGVTLVQYKLESDSDFHLDLSDGNGHTMIAEIPSPSCVSGGPWAAQIGASRSAFNAKFTPSSSFQSANVPVTITGVGFFDLPHGQTGIAPNGIELHAILSICFPGSTVSGCAATTPDFSLAASPASVSGSGTTSISVTGSGGFSGSVALAASGVPAGASASFSPASVGAGSSSTLSLNAGSAAAGTYLVTVTGTSATISHTASVSWSITGGGAIVNGDFENGLTGWTPSGTISSSSVAHGGAHSVQVGSQTAVGASSVAQAFTVPSGGGALSFWYQGVCNDTVKYAWASATLKDNTAGTTATLLPNTCAKTGQWVQVTSAALTAGHSMTLTLANQGEVFQTQYGYTLYDDVSLSGGGGGGGSALVNGDFEAGSLTGWTTSGTTAAVNSGAHGGSWAARVGGTTPSTDSSISQQVTLGSGAQLSFWVKVVCTDTITYDWATVQVKSASGSILATPLAKTCTNSGNWVQVSADLSAFAGQAVTLVLANHDDDCAGDPTCTLYDDVVLTGSSSTPDFTLSLAQASLSGAAADAVTVTPSGGFNASVALSVSGVPTGASASFSPASVASGSSTLTLTPGTAAAGTYGLTVSGAGGGLTRTAPLTWTLSSGGGGGAIQTVFIILMENHNWSQISGSASAPYINGTLLPQASYALNYVNLPGIHPSLPNYLWLEAGTNFGVLADGDPSTFHQSSTAHLVTQLQNAGIPWKSYSENITGTTCPLTTSGVYMARHDPMIYFDDVTNTNNSASANCIAHVRPFTELAADLQNNSTARYNFITPNACDDMHNSTGCATTDSVKNGDTWLSQNVPAILASAAYRNNGLLIITWDESEGGDFPIGLIVLSPKAKGHGYNNAIAYSHSSTLRSLQEIFNVQPVLGGAANATDLSDLFTSFP